MKSKHINIRSCQDLKEYLKTLGGDSKGIYKLYNLHKRLSDALKKYDIEHLELFELVDAIEHVSKKKKRLKTKRESLK